MNREWLKVLDGLPISQIPPNRIALSFVHPRERIDVAVSAIRWVEPRRFKVYFCGKRSQISSGPFVEICLAPYIRARIYRLTKEIVGEKVEIIVDGKCVTAPIVRQPLGVHQSIAISEFYYEDAVALAERLRARWNVTRSTPV